MRVSCLYLHYFIANGMVNYHFPGFFLVFFLFIFFTCIMAMAGQGVISKRFSYHCALLESTRARLIPWTAGRIRILFSSQNLALNG